jgi:hypothetical protein
LKRQLEDNPELRAALRTLLFAGKKVATLPDAIMEQAVLHGFVKIDEKDSIVISNRIFEMYLYDYFTRNNPDYLFFSELAGKDRAYFQDGFLNVNHILQRFSAHIEETMPARKNAFLEDEAGLMFLTFLKPYINGVGNYYVEAVTREDGRIDIIIDYLGRRHLIELKIWHGGSYLKAAENQIANYMQALNLKEGFILTFSFLTRKNVSDRTEKIVDEKKIIEHIVWPGPITTPRKPRKRKAKNASDKSNESPKVLDENAEKKS